MKKKHRNRPSRRKLRNVGRNAIRLAALSTRLGALADKADALEARYPRNTRRYRKAVRPLLHAVSHLVWKTARTEELSS